jgi:acetyl-CoA carboxylase carboxyl transferase subunit alpha
VISPEGCASILWRTGEKAEEAAEALKLTAPHLERLGIVDDVIAEPLGGAHRAPTEAAYAMEHYIVKTLRELKRMKLDDLVNARYDAWRDKGATLDDAAKPKPKKATKKKAAKKSVKK